jgi:UDP-N-acetylmuramyl pentapeptide phosphotransferase/UDP-N-acetylglucosamine-1-phosphate transferase
MPGLLLVGAALGSVVATGLVIDYLWRRAILDHPNERSSHVVPTPRGGGWGMLLVIGPAWAALAVPPAVLAAAAVLAVVSWIDDCRGLTPGPRLVVQGLAVAVGLTTLGDQARLFSADWPLWLDRGAAGVCWLWFLNLFNFMDGIDGLAGAEAAVVAGGLALVAPFLAEPALVPAEPALVLAGAALGFLVWNWQPARVFMGDVGSVSLGFLLGWLLATAAAAGLGPVAVLLPLYFVADATVTLLARLAAGRRPWQPHREHLYQRAVRAGWSHAQVVRWVLVADAGLVALAVMTPRLGWTALAGGGLVVLVLLGRLHFAAMAPLKCRHDDANSSRMR